MHALHDQPQCKLQLRRPRTGHYVPMQAIGLSLSLSHFQARAQVSAGSNSFCFLKVTFLFLAYFPSNLAHCVRDTILYFRLGTIRPEDSVNVDGSGG